MNVMHFKRKWGECYIWSEILAIQVTKLVTIFGYLSPTFESSDVKFPCKKSILWEIWTLDMPCNL